MDPLTGLARIRRSDHARNMRPLLGCLLGNNVSWEVRYYHFDNGSNASSPKKHTSSDAEGTLILKLRLSWFPNEDMFLCILPLKLRKPWSPCLQKRDMLCNAPRWHSVKLSVKELRRENAQKKVRLNVPSACKPEVHLEALLIMIFDIAWKRQLWSFWISVIKNKAVANKSQTSIAAPQLGLHGSACHRDISLGLRK